MKTSELKATESQEQIALFQWAATMEYKYPELRLLYSIPNGGKRPITTAKRMKAEGQKPGVPDMFLSVPRGYFHGLYIEMKSTDSRLSNSQDWWVDKLSQQGYKVQVCFGWEEAKSVIEKYLEE
jgi:hypothetical protein